MGTRRLPGVAVAAVAIATAGLSLPGAAAAAAPQVPLTEAASEVTATSATLNGLVNPKRAAKAGYHFSYGTQGSCEGNTTEPVAEATGKAIKAQATVTGLLSHTVYTFCLVATNKAGEATTGAPASFETLGERPTVGAQSSFRVSATGAQLSAQVNPNGQETTYAFQYATDEALTSAATIAGESPLSEELREAVPAGVIVTGLQPDTTYYYRALATNATGTGEAEAVQSFTTLALPIVTTGEAQGVTRTGATLTGGVDPGGAPTTYHFAYVPASGYQAQAANPYAGGATTPESESVGSDYAGHAVAPTLLGELRPGVTYDYALVATNSVGTTIGPNATFTTSAPASPAASTGEATEVSAFSATLSASVDTRGAPTLEQFEFGTVAGAGTLVPASIGSRSGTVLAVSLAFSGTLQPSTTYYYRAIASNREGTGDGAERSFTTASLPSAPFAPTVTSALLAQPQAAVLAAKEAQASHVATAPAKPLTRAQKLARALEACRRKPRPRRAACQTQARRRYGSKPR
jgi:hypothetical protein